MVRQLLDRLSENQERVISVAESGQSLADVETESEYYEIETGLKTRTSDLEERISKLTSSSRSSSLSRTLTSRRARSIAR